MRTDTTAVVQVTALIENYDDVRSAEERPISGANVRRVEVLDAYVDTRATYVWMPTRLINQLGLERIKTVEVKTVAGPIAFGIFELVKVTIQGRDCEVRVAEVADHCPVLIGLVPLGMLDFVVDEENHRLIGNPDHGGEFMIDMY